MEGELSEGGESVGLWVQSVSEVAVEENLPVQGSGWVSELLSSQPALPEVVFG